MSEASVTKQSIFLVHGEDEFGVKTRAKQIFEGWTSDPGTEREVFDGTASNASEALKAIANFVAALQTFPFFGSSKAVWLQDCNFLADDRTASSSAVTAALVDLANFFKSTPLSGVRVLITAAKVDKRKTFYKTLEKLGTVETLAGWSIDDRDWASKAEQRTRQKLQELGKSMQGEALGELVFRVGTNPRTLVQELEKLAIYSGEKPEITRDAVVTMVSRNKQARSFALAEAVGNRESGPMLRCLDEEFSEIDFTAKSEIGILYAVISKIRLLLLLSEAVRLRWLSPSGGTDQVKVQLGKIPADRFPRDKKFNLAAQHPFVVFQGLKQVRNFTQNELIQAMETLQKANLELISSNTDKLMVLQRALLSVVGAGAAKISVKA